MPGELIDVRHDDRFSLFEAGATHASAFPDPRAGYRTLEGAEDQFLSADEIETDPKPAKLLLQGSRNVAQVGDQVLLLTDQRFDLFPKKMSSRKMTQFF